MFLKCVRDLQDKAILCSPVGKTEGKKRWIRTPKRFDQIELVFVSGVDITNSPLYFWVYMCSFEKVVSFSNGNRQPQYVLFIKDVLYSMLGPDLVGLTVAVWNIVGRCLSAVCRGLNTIPIPGVIGLIVADSGH